MSDRNAGGFSGTIRASAPGKLMLAGEYAVLDGAPAVMIAVDRRAIARADAPGAPSEFLAAAADSIAKARGASSRAARAARTIAVDSSALHDGAIKLGLGSSAAATVAAVACALAHEGGPIDRDEIHRLAAAAHGDAQAARGARGSGADVAASTYGGTIAFTAGAVRPLPAVPVTILPFWTGVPADTATLVAAVAAARAERPQAVGPALRVIALAAEALVHAVSSGDPALVIAAITTGGQGLALLARATGLELEPPVVAAVRAALGATAACKTCGAGGGDVAIAALPSAGFDLDRARAVIRAAGGTPLGISVGAPGVDILR